MTDDQITEVGYSSILLENILECDRHFGLDDYRTFVERLRHSVTNIHDGPPLRDIIDKYRNGTWRKSIQDELEEWRRKNIDLKDELDVIQDETAKLEDDHYSLLCDFIRQLLEENGCIEPYYRGEH